MNFLSQNHIFSHDGLGLSTSSSKTVFWDYCWLVQVKQVEQVKNMMYRQNSQVKLMLSWEVQDCDSEKVH